MLLKCAQCTGTLSKSDHMLCQKTGLNAFRNQITQSVIPAMTKQNQSTATTKKAAQVTRVGIRGAGCGKDAWNPCTLVAEAGGPGRQPELHSENLLQEYGVLGLRFTPPEDHLWGSNLSFYHVGLGDWTQVIKLGSKHPYPLSQLVGPKSVKFSVCVCLCLENKKTVSDHLEPELQVMWLPTWVL